MRISDWSSDVCSSVLAATHPVARPGRPATRPVRRAARARGYSSGWPPDIDREVDGSLIAITIRDDADDNAPDGERRREYPDEQIGRASCRERVCQYGSIPVVAVSLKTQNKKKQ